MKVRIAASVSFAKMGASTNQFEKIRKGKKIMYTHSEIFCISRLRKGMASSSSFIESI